MLTLVRMCLQMICGIFRGNKQTFMDSSPRLAGKRAVNICPLGKKRSMWTYHMAVCLSCDRNQEFLLSSLVFISVSRIIYVQLRIDRCGQNCFSSIFSVTWVTIYFLKQFCPNIFVLISLQSFSDLYGINVVEVDTWNIIGGSFSL